MLPDLTSVYAGEINAVSWNTSAWCWQNPRVLLAPPPKGGSNLEVPRGEGEVPMRRRLGALETSVQMVFIGDCDPDGNRNTNPARGLLDNLHEFADDVYYDTADELPVWLREPGGRLWSGNCQTLSFDWGDSETAGGLTTCRAVLRVVVLQRLEEVTSV